MSDRASGTGRRWTPAEDAAILDPAAMGRLAEVARSLGRTPQSARDRRHLLSKRWRARACRNPLHEVWTAREDDVMRAVARLYPRRLPNHGAEALAVLFPVRTPESCKARLSMMTVGPCRGEVPNRAHRCG